jgi:uncharacterized protein (DUF58 family)
MRIKAEELTLQIPKLLVKANNIANTVWEGVHNRNKAGVGDNFWQFRKYEYGYPAHLIDWKKSAKSYDIFVQEKELDTLQNVVIWRDTSKSMDFSSSKVIEKKIYRANLLTLALTIILSKSGENIVLNGFNSKLLHGKEVINFISDQLTKKVKDDYLSEPNIDEIKSNSDVILISDFLNDIKHTEEILRKLSARGINGNMIHILDPAEKTFPYKGRINFNGLEEEESILIGNAESIKNNYKKAMNSHCTKIKKLSLSYSWKYYMDTTDNSPESSLLKICNTLSNYNILKVDA